MSEISEKEIEAAIKAFQIAHTAKVNIPLEQSMRDALEAAARVRAENDAFRDAVVTGLGAVKMNADGTTERVDLRAEANAGGPVAALADALRGLLKAYENAFDWSAELPPETAEAERIANEVLALTAGKPKPVPSAWQPIETAPRDGTDILGWHEIAGTSQTCFSEGEWVCPDWDEDRYIHCTWSPTHWMPLPTPPTAGGSDE